MMEQNPQQHPQDGGGGGFLAGFLVGALVGVAIALVISQEDARDVLFGKAREAGNLAADATGDLRDRVTGVTASWTANASDLYARGKEIVDNARSTVSAAVDEGKSAAEQTRDDLSRDNPGSI